MRLPRFRVRTLMIVVAVLAAGIGAAREFNREMYRRRLSYASYRNYHVMMANRICVEGEEDTVTAQAAAKAKWHTAMAWRYHSGVEHPWFPMPPCPPEPK